jgi:hypothetical protein
MRIGTQPCNRHVLVQVAIFVLAMDFWAWGKREPVFLGVPLWVICFVLLSALQTGAVACMIRREFSRSNHATIEV